ncbi:MAG: AAA family ATPase [Actinobacteria bacterium]|nr:AAA family ATPase [Actinomycetota bacterium]
MVVLIGLQGSGKSTFARRHFAPVEILSSDEFRARLCNDPASQSNTAAALEHLTQTLRRRLLNQVTTAIDATNIRHERRADLLDAAHEHGVPAVAVLFDIPADRCRERIAARHRNIRDEVLNEQAERWPQVMRDVPNEGYSAVHILTEHQVPAVQFRHAPPNERDPDRWVEVDRLDATGQSLRFPADEIRRQPDVLAAHDPGPYLYACAAANRAFAPPSGSKSTPSEPMSETIVRVQLPHCLPIYLTHHLGNWHRTDPHPLGTPIRLPGAATPAM